MTLTIKQQHTLQKLEEKFVADIDKIKKKQMEIIKRYEFNKAKFVADKIRKKIKHL